MEDKKLYQKIYKKALLILVVCMFLTYLITKNGMYVVSTLFGGILSMASFLCIILFTSHTTLEGNVRGKFTSAYIVRYLIYFIAMFMAIKAGLNILSILIGFLCINLSIKMNTLLQRREED